MHPASESCDSHVVCGDAVSKLCNDRRNQLRNDGRWRRRWRRRVVHIRVVCTMAKQCPSLLQAPAVGCSGLKLKVKLDGIHEVTTRRQWRRREAGWYVAEADGTVGKVCAQRTFARVGTVTAVLAHAIVGGVDKNTSHVDTARLHGQCGGVWRRSRLWRGGRWRGRRRRRRREILYDGCCREDDRTGNQQQAEHEAQQGQCGAYRHANYTRHGPLRRLLVYLLGVENEALVGCVCASNHPVG
jgi:hypothetical protein